MFGEKTDDNIKFERAVALRAIASRADELRNSGAQPFEIQSFINGARGELAREAPDPDMYRRALRAAALQKRTRGTEESDDRTGFGSFSSNTGERPGSPQLDPGGPPTNYTVPSTKEEWARLQNQSMGRSEGRGGESASGGERPGSPQLDPGGPPTDYTVPSTKEEWARASASGPTLPSNASQATRDLFEEELAAWKKLPPAPTSHEEVMRMFKGGGGGGGGGRSMGRSGGRGGRGGESGGRGEVRGRNRLGY
jgi:hypothetical protein